MAKAKFDIKTEAARPLLAGVGVTDLAVERVRGVVADVQKKFVGVQKDVQKSVNDLDFQPQALREQAVTVVSARVDALSKDAKARRTAIEARVAELQAEAKAYPAKVQALLNENVAAYDELVKRGETLVCRIRRQEATKRTASSAKKAMASLGCRSCCCAGCACRPCCWISGRSAILTSKRSCARMCMCNVRPWASPRLSAITRGSSVRIGR